MSYTYSSLKYSQDDSIQTRRLSSQQPNDESIARESRLSMADHGATHALWEK